MWCGRDSRQEFVSTRASTTKTLTTITMLKWRASFSKLTRFAVFTLSISKLKLNVLSAGSKQAKILNAIICFVVVNVMHSFFPAEVTT